MAAVLNSNVASLWASKNLQGAQSKMADSVERLSSGLRINRARMMQQVWALPMR
jgi:flagellin